MNKKYSIIVVGSGPVGLTLANLLGKHGISTLLLERNLTTVQEPRAVSIDDESLRTMQAINADSQIMDLCAMDYGSVYLDLKRKPFAKIEPASIEYGFPRRNAFMQPDLEAMLRQNLRQYSCIETRYGHTVTKFSQNEQDVTLTVETDNESYQVEGEYFAAADGGRSFTRTTLDIPLEGVTYEQKWLIVDLVGTKDTFRQTRVYCDPERPGINLPGPKGVRRFEFMILPGETDEQVVEESFVRQLLSNYGPDENATIIRKQVYAFHARKTARWREGRIFLLGDAAHLTPPFAGQGMNSGLRDSANLAWKFAWVIKHGMPDALLDSYEEERKPHAWQLIEMSLTLGKFMMPKSKLRAWLMQTSLRSLSLYKPVRDYVTQMKYKPTPQFPSGWFIRHKKNDTRSRTGVMIAQPLLEMPDRSQKKLDTLTLSGFYFLAYNVVPDSAFSLLDPYQQGLDSSILRVCITPKFFNALDNPHCITTRDIKGQAHQWIFKSIESSIFLVRPDNYVMAEITPQNASDLIPKLLPMLKQKPKY